MSLKRLLTENATRLVAGFAQNAKVSPSQPRSIFILRNNDIGDLLAITPLFAALKQTFPRAEIVAGIGDWNRAVLQNNPWVDRVLPINAPWHNKQVCRLPHNSPRGLLHSVRYIYTSDEIRRLKDARCDIGIDVLGSPEGSLLLMRAGIPWRLGVNGYAGGHSACQQTVTFSEHIQVGRAVLKFAELLGAKQLPDNRPQLFLTRLEQEQALKTWNTLNPSGTKLPKRIVLAPGGGFAEKCWPREYYQKLAAQLTQQPNVQVMILGGPADYELGELVKGGSNRITNLCGKTSLRETFALIGAADGVVCNSSMVSHTAAAFDKPTVVMLGKTFDSAQSHKQLWGYGTNDVHLGRDPDRDQIFTPEEVWPVLIKHFRLSSDPQ